MHNGEKLQNCFGFNENSNFYYLFIISNGSWVYAPVNIKAETNKSNSIFIFMTNKNDEETADEFESGNEFIF